MKRYSITICLLSPVLAMVLLGWTPSLHPIYTEDDLYFEPALCGTWQCEEEGWTLLEFAENPDIDMAYDLSFTDDEGNPGSLLLRLVKVEDHMFLDCFPPMHEDLVFGDDLTLDLHGFVLVEKIEPEFVIRDLDGEWLRDYLGEHPDELKLDTVQSVYADCSSRLLTSTTEEIQAFMVKHIDTEGAYGEPISFNQIDMDE